MTTDTSLATPGTDRMKSPGKRARGRGSRIIVWANVAFALAVIVPSFFSESTGATGLTAQIGTLLLLATLLPSNLLRFDWWGRRGWVRGLARLRKPLGIGSGIWFVAHSLVALEEYFLGLQGSLVRQLLIGDVALGIAAALIFVALLVTSTRSWQRSLGGNWKRLQRLAWFAVPLSLAHTALSSLRLNEVEPPSIVLFGVILIFAVVEFSVLRTRRRARSKARRTAWTHAGLVLAGVAVAVLIYGASWVTVGPWELTNDAPSEQSVVLFEARRG